MSERGDIRYCSFPKGLDEYGVKHNSKSSLSRLSKPLEMLAATAKVEIYVDLYTTNPETSIT